MLVYQRVKIGFCITPQKKMLMIQPAKMGISAIMRNMGELLALTR
jgi:hypothetical protein